MLGILRFYLKRFFKKVCNFMGEIDKLIIILYYSIVKNVMKVKVKFLKKSCV